MGQGRACRLWLASLQRGVPNRGACHRLRLGRPGAAPCGQCPCGRCVWGCRAAALSGASLHGCAMAAFPLRRVLGGSRVPSHRGKRPRIASPRVISQSCLVCEFSCLKRAFHNQCCEKRSSPARCNDGRALCGRMQLCPARSASQCYTGRRGTFRRPPKSKVGRANRHGRDRAPPRAATAQNFFARAQRAARNVAARASVARGWSARPHDTPGRPPQLRNSSQALSRPLSQTRRYRGGPCAGLRGCNSSNPASSSAHRAMPAHAPLVAAAQEPRPHACRPLRMQRQLARSARCSTRAVRCGGRIAATRPHACPERVCTPPLLPPSAHAGKRAADEPTPPHIVAAQRLLRRAASSAAWAPAAAMRTLTS
jgi:hypothetical protein